MTATRRCIIFRHHQDAPPLDLVAKGAEALGYHVQVEDPLSFRTNSPPEAELVVVGGGLTRYDFGNARIMHHYTHVGAMAVLLEFSWIRPDHWLVYLGGKPWLPPARLVDSARRLAQGLGVRPQPRGEEILICGQRPNLDRQLEETVRTMAENSKRLIVYRRHPHAKNIPPVVTYDMPRAFSRADSANVNEGQPSLLDDLAAAWVVVTHSSNVGITALEMGLPVVSSRAAVFSDVAHPLGVAAEVDSIAPAHLTSVEQFFNRFSYVHWAAPELASGEALSFLEECSA